MTGDERIQIEAAMDRPLAGVLLRSDGTLTVVSLAIEAGVKRHVLTHRHTDLKDRFYARVKAQNAVPASETALREQIIDLRRKVAGMRAERDEYKQAADALALRTERAHRRERRAALPGQPSVRAGCAHPAGPGRLMRRCNIPRPH